VKIRILFVSSGNTGRSLTGEALFQFDGRYEAKSCGISDDAPVQLSRGLIEWADIVFAMQDMHKKVFLRLMPRACAKIRVLQVPDIYEFGDPVLVEVLVNKLRFNGITVANRVSEGKCECGGRVVVTSDGERICQDCGAMYGRSSMVPQKDRNRLPCDFWNGSIDNQERQLEADVERRGWG
jgi:predicted protein tyrosine phosphatase